MYAYVVLFIELYDDALDDDMSATYSDIGKEEAHLSSSGKFHS